MTESISLIDGVSCMVAKTSVDVTDPMLGAEMDDEPSSGVAVIKNEKALFSPSDIRSLAVSGSDIFTTIKWETLRDDGTVFYIGDIQEKYSDGFDPQAPKNSFRSLMMDIYDSEGVLTGRCQVAALSVQTQVDDLRRAYPTAPFFGPFRIVKWGKTYKLEPVRS